MSRVAGYFLWIKNTEGSDNTSFEKDLNWLDMFIFDEV